MKYYLLAIMLFELPGVSWADGSDDTQCHRVLEGNIMAQDSIAIPPAYLTEQYVVAEGFRVEKYFYFWGLAKEELKLQHPPRYPELAEFSGVRVTDCASGRFIAIDTYADSGEVASALYGTEFLRMPLEAGESVSFTDVESAAKAVFDHVFVLEETSETCSCFENYPDLRPANLLPFGDRTDVTRQN